MPALQTFRLSFRVLVEAFYRFNRDDGWAIASHISLSVLLSVFPFLIVVTAIAGFVGSVNLADEVARLMFAVWPQQVATPIAAQIHNVLTTAHGGVLTLGAVFSVYFASSGVESLRIGLNRAYGLQESRGWWLLRLEFDRLRAGERFCHASSGVPGGAGAAYFPDGAQICAVDRAA